MNYGKFTEEKLIEVVDICKRYGSNSIVALAGVPGTGKSFVASIAAQRITNEPLFVREIQFHQSFSYEEFIEGLRIDKSGAVSVHPGVFLEWNEKALENPNSRFVLLIEELTRANLSSVLGELLTFLEHRERPFLTLYSRRPVKVAPNLTILATYNPTDRSAIEIDSALLRRLRLLSFPPSTEQLSEMLNGRGLSSKVIDRLQHLFTRCQSEFGEDYTHLMPFGHGVFSDVKSEYPDLHQLWTGRIVHMIRRPLLDPHPFTEVIEQSFPWRDKSYREP